MADDRICTRCGRAGHRAHRCPLKFNVSRAVLGFLAPIAMLVGFTVILLLAEERRA